MKKAFLFCVSLLLFFFTGHAQFKLGNNLTTIDANSLLELEHSTKLLVLSSASLSSTTAKTPFSASLKTGALVFNTNASISAGSSSYPISTGGIGLYVWDGSGWVSLKWTTPDASLLNRANHTGTQTASTISDFDASVSANSAVAANTAKVTNQTHTGDVTGSTALTYNNVVPANKGGAGTVSGLMKANGSGTVSAAVAGTDYLTPTGSAAGLTSFPTLNQNTTGTASNVTGTVALANGGTGGTTAAAARTNLGATTVGANLFTLTNPAAITFPRFNADNTVSALDAATFRSAIGAGTSSTTGTVTSVGGTGTVSGLSLSGTVTSSGNLTLGGTLSVAASNFASQTANTLLIAPNGSAGVPTFRALVAADIPTLNQNTTGTASNVTGTVALANGGTGGTTAAAARTNLGATTVGANLFTLTNPAAITFPRFNADNTVTALDASSFRTAIGAGTGSGTVTSVGGTGTVSGLSLSGTVTSSGNLTLGGTLSVTQSNLNLTGDIVINSVNAGKGLVTTGTRFGENALASGSLSGNYNTAFGNGALRYLTSGSNNVGIGYQALNAASFTGSDNMAIGTTSLLSCTSGYENTAIGTSSLPNLTTAFGNVAIGKYAGYNISTSASYNTFVGHSAGGGITTGNYNTIIGALIGSLSSTLSNWVIIGDGAGNRRINIDNAGRMAIGNNTPTTSAMLEVASTSYGFLPPRMTNSQKGSISGPVAGLIVYCTDCTANDASTGVAQCYNGSTWKNFW